ncbi:MAG: hypothetical protein KC549_04430, partial [Myxococcales bacterium]|nr:hypothetical protein [Myxococcales bacterium]
MVEVAPQIERGADALRQFARGDVDAALQTVKGGLGGRWLLLDDADGLNGSSAPWAAEETVERGLQRDWTRAVEAWLVGLEVPTVVVLSRAPAKSVECWKTFAALQHDGPQLGVASGSDAWAPVWEATARRPTGRILAQAAQTCVGQGEIEALIPSHEPGSDRLDSDLARLLLEHMPAAWSRLIGAARHLEGVSHA